MILDLSLKNFVEVSGRPRLSNVPENIKELIQQRQELATDSLPEVPSNVNVMLYKYFYAETTGYGNTLELVKYDLSVEEAIDFMVATAYKYYRRVVSHCYDGRSITIILAVSR